MSRGRIYCHASGDLRDIRPDDSSDWVGYRVSNGCMWWANYPSAALNGRLVVAGTYEAIQAAERLFRMSES